MTKEELKKEAEEKADIYVEDKYDEENDCFSLGYARFVEGYLAGAEPREKRIAELEEKLANADYQLEGRDNEIRKFEKENKVLTQNLEDSEIIIAGLKTQIEKMKCCTNCQTVRDAEGNCYLKKDGKCKDKDKWELRR